MKKVFILKNQAGFTIAELMIAIGIGSILTLGLMSMLKSNYKESVDQQVLTARLDLEKPVLDYLNNGANCTFILNDASQSTNRSSDTFDATKITETNPYVINIQNLLVKANADSPVFATTGKPASLLSTKLLIKGMRFLIKANQPPDLFLADFEIEFNQPLPTRKVSNIVVKDIQIATDSTTPPNAKKIIGCGGAGEALAQRITFLSDSTWTVPVGRRRAFITMAGGGGSGLGWRIISNYATGHSGGYVFSQPINVTPGEVLQVIVGKGAKGYPAINSGVPATPGPPYYIFSPPPGDDGLGGYPGSASKLVSPTLGVLLECDGGSGATVAGIDSYDGSLVAGGMAGARTGSGSPTLSAPNRIADGPYATAGGPGGCGPGPAGYGRGNSGITKWGLQSGSKAGGSTPFGYGSGGGVTIMGCYVNSTDVGTCIYPANGRDGVVYIDIW